MSSPAAKAKVDVRLGDYRSAPDLEATWFVDPPYQPTRGMKTGQGLGYAPGCTSRELDYGELAEWCRSRRGQVIVCEQEGADWLPFRPCGTSATRGASAGARSSGRATVSRCSR